MIRSEYRSEEEEAYYKGRDCLVRIEQHIVDGGFASESELRAIDDECVQAVADAVAFADGSPFPEAEELLTDVYVRYG